MTYSIKENTTIFSLPREIITQFNQEAIQELREKQLKYDPIQFARGIRKEKIFKFIAAQPEYTDLFQNKLNILNVFVPKDLGFSEPEQDLINKRGIDLYVETKGYSANLLIPVDVKTSYLIQNQNIDEYNISFNNPVQQIKDMLLRTDNPLNPKPPLSALLLFIADDYENNLDNYIKIYLYGFIYSELIKYSDVLLTSFKHENENGEKCAYINKNFVRRDPYQAYISALRSKKINQIDTPLEKGLIKTFLMKYIK